jgi:hypothetical protein
MATTVGEASTVQELIDILKKFPPDKPVRARTLSHEWPVTVQEHAMCLTVDAMD